jgi:hypothetical protein
MSLLQVELDEEICALAADAQDLASSDDPADVEERIKTDARLRAALVYAIGLRHRSERRMLAAGKLTARTCTIRANGRTVNAFGKNLGEAYDRACDALEWRC